MDQMFSPRYSTWEFPGGPAVRTLCFHCQGPKFNPQSHKPPGGGWGRGAEKQKGKILNLTTFANILTPKVNFTGSKG